MKLRFSQLAPGTCFRRGKKGLEQKKLPDGRAVSVSPKGRVSTRAVKGDPEVSTVACSLKLIGTGLRHPETMVEIG